MRMILLQGARIAVAGLVIGLVAAFGLTRYLAELLFSVSAPDPTTFAAVAGVLGGAALLACYLSVRRALRVDPIIALRCD